MGTRTGKEPETTDSFLWRICHAVALKPKELAKAIGVHYREVEPLLEGQRSELAEIDRDEVWWKIYEFLGKRMGYLLAVRYELDRALQKDRTKRVQRIERFNKHHGKVQTTEDSN